MNKHTTLPIIFLDIDGVLNNQLMYKAQYEAKISGEFADETMEEHDLRQFDPACVELLNGITDEFNARIVVSSSWRGGRSVEDLQNLFKKVGITGEVIGKTPHLRFTDQSTKHQLIRKLKEDDVDQSVIDTITEHFGQESYRSVPRGCEIKAWLEANKGLLGTGIGRYRNYVIIDDDSDMLWWQRENYFRTDSYCGLTPNVAHRIRLFFGSSLFENSTTVHLSD